MFTRGYNQKFLLNRTCVVVDKNQDISKIVANLFIVFSYCTNWHIYGKIGDYNAKNKYTKCVVLEAFDESQLKDNKRKRDARSVKIKTANKGCGC